MPPWMRSWTKWVSSNRRDTTVKLQESAKLQVSTDHAEVGESDNAKTGQTLSENKGHDPRSRSPPERAAALSHNRIPP
jgi:hypothetical protein